MNVLEAAPTADSEEETPSGTEITAKVTTDAIQFTDFPVRDLIIKVIGSEEGVDQIMESLGKVDYSIPYTAEINEDKTSVGLFLAPEPLELTLATGTTADGSGDTEGLTIEVEITSEGADCIYDIESKNLTFKLSAAGVKVEEIDLPDFTPFSLEFDLTKKQ